MVSDCVELVEVKLWYAGCCQRLRDLVVRNCYFAISAVGVPQLCDGVSDVFNCIYVFAIDGSDGAMMESAPPVF
jgi:hypothetical protein